VKDWAAEEGIAETEILERLNQATAELMEEKASRAPADVYYSVQKRVLMQTLDHLWKDHLLSLDHLRQGIHLRGYAQKDPLNEYKRDAFAMFETMLTHLREMVISRLALIEVRYEVPELEAPLPRQMKESRYDPTLAEMTGSEMEQPEGELVQMRNHVAPEDRNPNDPSTWGKVGRNENCPCGSGKKYKHCHGKLE
jgi:preprotein translocase subunit SecA